MVCRGAVDCESPWFGARLGVFSSLLAMVVGVVAFVAMAYLRSNPPNLALAAGRRRVSRWT